VVGKDIAVKKYVVRLSAEEHTQLADADTHPSQKSLTRWCREILLFKYVCAPSAIPSFFEIKESGGVRTLSEKNLIVIF
jgi:hypothetical protein